MGVAVERHLNHRHAVGINENRVVFVVAAELGAPFAGTGVVVDPQVAGEFVQAGEPLSTPGECARMWFFAGMGANMTGEMFEAMERLVTHGALVRAVFLFVRHDREMSGSVWGVGGVRRRRGAGDVSGVMAIGYSGWPQRGYCGGVIAAMLVSGIMSAVDTGWDHRWWENPGEMLSAWDDPWDRGSVEVWVRVTVSEDWLPDTSAVKNGLGTTPQGEFGSFEMCSRS